MEGGGSFCFGQGAHLGGGGAPVMSGTGMIPTGMASLLFGASMPAPGDSMVQVGGYLPSAGYDDGFPNVLHAAWNSVADAGGQQQPQVGHDNAVRRPAPRKGPWTEEEDETLRAMVAVHGERKWAVICKYLPGRIGKQCRERWTNHLHPEIDKEKSIWTEDDDRELIELHKKHGNRWSVIARKLVGRSENSVKNHWNATKRSLRARRRLKKKKNPEARPGQQWSILEQYILSVQPPAGAVAARRAARAAQLPPPADSPPSSYNTGYGEVVSPPQPKARRFDPPALGLYLGAAGSNSSSPAASVNLAAMMMNRNPDLAPPPYLGLDLNSYSHYGAHLQAARVLQMMGGDQQQQASSSSSSYANSLMTSYNHFVDSMARRSSAVHADGAHLNNGNAGRHYYCYGDAGAGPSGTAGGRGGGANNADDVDVVGMASREFLSPSDEEVTLNLAGFM